MKKRLLSILLTVLMIASLLPATALAANIVDSGTCGAEGDGSNLTWTLDSDGVLTISGSGDMHGYGSSGAPWHGRVKSAVIAEGVTSISWCAFYDCTSLTSVTIPDSVTSIGSYAFYDCRFLTSVTIPDSVTSIGDYAFKGCTSLTSVTIPDSVTSIGDGAFSRCTSLTSVTIPDSVTSIGNFAFQGCTSLTSVTIPNSVTSIGDWAFYDCTSLTSVTIPDSVMLIGSSAFEGCASLTSVTIPDSVTSINWYAFSHCKSLTSVTIPNSVTSIGEYAFAHCKSLTSVAIPNSVTSINSSAFEDCTSLTSVTIPDSVTSIDFAAFSNCTSLTSVTIPDSVTSIGERAFFECTSLTSVTIPDSVTYIGESAFYNCTSLTDVYYAGSEAQWKAISISSTGNDDLLTANIHYNYGSHTHSYKDVVTAPTCTEKGYTTHTCACGDSYVDTYTDALGHAWDNGKVTKEPTETETGIKTYTCTRCSATKTELIPAVGCPTAGFTDAPSQGWWSHVGLDYCVEHGILSGVGDGRISPNGLTTRAQFVQMLYSIEGKPEVSGALPFTDLPEVWYRNAVLWAYQTGVTSGTSDTTFSPYATVTRAQVATFLMKYAKTVCNVKPTWTPADLSKYPDVNNVPGWALGAMQDAVALGLINGSKASDGTIYLDPNGNAPREQVATILMQFCKNVKK